MHPITRSKVESAIREAGGWRLFWMAVLGTAFLVVQSLAANARPESLAPLAEKVSPAVVNITTSTIVEGRTGPQGIVPEGSPFEDFFRERGAFGHVVIGDQITVFRNHKARAQRR